MVMVYFLRTFPQLLFPQLLFPQLLFPQLLFPQLLFPQLLFPLDPKLIEIHKRLPANAKYTSYDIQDEVIAVLASLTQEKIAEEIKEAKLFTIMADGITDKNRKEVGLVCRYWTPNGNLKEHCLNIRRYR